MRKGRSFWNAAALSGLLFALIHIINLVNGTSPEILLGISISIFFGFILAGALFHFAVDSINYFKELGSSGAPMNSYLAFILIAAALIMLIAKKDLRGTELGPK